MHQGRESKGVVSTRFIFAAILFLAGVTARRTSAATSLHFERGNAVQLIDAQGQLIEWPFVEELGWSGIGITELEGRHFAQRELIATNSDVFFADPLPVVSMWPVARPAEITSWVRADEYLAQATTGQLFEIRTAGKLFGEPLVHSTVPAPIAFPPGVTAWKDFASGPRLRLAVDTDGKLWAWESHVTNHPAYIAQLSPVVWGVVSNTIGTNYSQVVNLGDDLIMYQLDAPAANVTFKHVNFPKWNRLLYPMKIPPNLGSATAPYSEPFTAITSDGEIYQFGAYLKYATPEPGLEQIIELPTNAPVKLDRPADVVAWSDLKNSGSQLAALTELGELYVWGNNFVGQLGIGSLDTPEAVVNLPKPEGVNRWQRMEVSETASFALGDDGTLYGWGQLSPYRAIVPGQTDVASDQSPFSLIKIRPTPLVIGSPDDPVVDFAFNAETLAVLQESGTYSVFYDFFRSSDHSVSSSSVALDQTLPPGTENLVDNRAPFVRTVSPLSSSSWSQTTNLTIVAEATDVDSSIESVTLLVNGLEIGPMRFDQGFYRYDWTRIPRGRHELIVHATDKGGLSSDSIPVVLYDNRPSPQLTGLHQNLDGTISITIDSNEWAPMQLERSDDLKQWKVLMGIDPLTNDTSQTVEDPASGSRSFYRVLVDESSNGN